MSQKLLDRIEDRLEEEGPVVFTRRELEACPGLFNERSALYHTPTSALPEAWVGSGCFDLRLPLVPPSLLELDQQPAYRSERLWVDLLQRATWKIRWTPLAGARIRLTCCDVVRPPDALYGGVQCLLAALRGGEAPGPHYFGAIADEPDRIECELVQEHVSHPAKAHSRLELLPV